MATPNYYEVLGLEQTATTAEIKEAYRRLAKQYHPDKNTDAGAKEQFQLINEAHAVLSDDDKRRRYDRVLASGGTFNDSDDPGAAFAAHPVFEELLRGMFGAAAASGGGGGGGGGGGSARGAAFPEDFGFRAYNAGSSSSGTGRSHGQHHHHHHHHNHRPPRTILVEYTLEEVFKREKKKVLFKRRAPCDFCQGTGAASNADVDVCTACKGSGRRVRAQQLGAGFVQQAVVRCDVCMGQGRIVRVPCETCSGNRVIEETATLLVSLDQPDGQLTYPGEGDRSIDGSAEDLIVELKQKPHDVYHRHSSRPEVVLDLPKLSGGHFTERLTGVIKPGEQRVMKGCGLPTGKKTYGDLLVLCDVVFPERIDATKFSALTELLLEPDRPLGAKPSRKPTVRADGGATASKKTSNPAAGPANAHAATFANAADLASAPGAAVDGAAAEADPIDGTPPALAAAAASSSSGAKTVAGNGVPRKQSVQTGSAGHLAEAAAAQPAPAAVRARNPNLVPNKQNASPNLGPNIGPNINPDIMNKLDDHLNPTPGGEGDGPSLLKNFANMFRGKPGRY